MRFSTILSTASLASLAQATCVTELTSLINPMTAGALPTMTATQDSVATYCADPAAVQAKFDALVATCRAEAATDSSLAALLAPVELISSLVCQNDKAVPKPHYCYPDFAQLVPWTSLFLAANSGVVPDFNFVGSFVADKLKLACGNAYCESVFTELAVKVAVNLPFPEAKPVVFKYARDMATTCTKVVDPVTRETTWCAETFKTLFAPASTFTVPTLSQVCENGEPLPCIRNALSQRLAFTTDGSLTCPADQKYVCDNLNLVATELGTFTLGSLKEICAGQTGMLQRIPNVYSFVVTNVADTVSWDDLKNAIASDLMFNFKEIDISKFKFTQPASGRRLLQDPIVVQYEASQDAANNPCPDFYYPTFSNLNAANGAQEVTFECTANPQWPAGYTAPTAAPTVKQALSDEGSASVATLSTGVALLAAAFAM